MHRPGPTRVWLVREGDPTAIEGTLSLDEANLTFVPEPGETEKLTIPVIEIQRARRSRGTPILSLAYPAGEGMQKLFAYFVKPPPLSVERALAPKPMLRGPRSFERSAAALHLRAANRLLKRDIDVWVRAIRDAGAEG